MGKDVRWYIGGEPILPKPDGRFFWQLTPGEWTLRAIGRNGAVEQTFKVE
jgi:membrane carboxypeptidase/penicillin-binding protein PbpC